MGELLDRAFQHEILTTLAAQYPNIAQIHQTFGHQWVDRKSEYVVNVHYLHEHDLVEATFSQPVNGPLQLVMAKITARGLDFLARDGGLGAILGVVTVKLHEDTIRELLVRRISDARGDVGLKESLIEKVRGLPAEALGKLTTDGLDAALQQVPDLLALLRSVLP